MIDNINDFGIFITTFSKRFSYVENLVKSIRNQTDIEVFININGDYKKSIDREYRDKILNLCLKYDKVYPRFYNIFRSYGYMCNDFICNCNKLYNIITNDDIIIKNNFFEEFFNFLNTCDLSNTLVRVNDSSSTFFISRELTIKNKFFDERFLGLGCEDSDFYHRLLKWNVNFLLKHFKTENYINHAGETWNTLIDQSASTVSKYHNFNYKMNYELQNESENNYIHPRPNEKFFFDNYESFWTYHIDDTNYLKSIKEHGQNVKK